MCGAPCWAASAAARRSSALNSGSAPAPQRSRWLATLSSSAPMAISARAVSRCRRSRRPRGRSSPIALAMRWWAKRAPPAPAGRPPRARRARPPLVQRDVGHGGHDLARRAFADDGQRLDDGAVARRQLGQAGADDGARDCAERRGVALGRVERAHAAVGDLTAELAQQPRVASRRAVALVAGLERGRRRRAADQPRRAASGQRLGVQHRRRARRPDEAEQVRGHVGIVARAPMAMRRGRSAIRRARYASTSNDGRSAQCASSTTSMSGASSARAEHSHSTLWAIAMVASASGTAPLRSRAPAGAAAP